MKTWTESPSALCQTATAVHVVQVYDVVLDAALRAQKCGPSQLLVQGEWEWLLAEFAGLTLALCLQIFAISAMHDIMPTHQSHAFL